MKLTSIHLKSRTAGLMASIAVALASAYGQQYYIYNGQQVPLTVVPEKVAVRSAAATTDAAQTQRAAASVASVNAAAAQSIGLAGWSVVNVTASQNATIRAQASTAAVSNVSSAALSAVQTLAASPSVAFAAPVYSVSGQETIPSGEILVGLTPGSNIQAVLAALNNRSITGSTLVAGNTYKLTTSLKNGADVVTLANSLNGRPGIAFSEPNFIQTGKSNLIPNDPLFAQAWGLRNVGQSSGQVGFDMAATTAWDTTLGSSTVIVVVFECGIDPAHPDINATTGRDFTNAPVTGAGPRPTGNEGADNHGTWVAGCISGRANNGLGATGVAPGVRIASARIGIPTSGRNFSAASDWIVAALDWARSIGARVTNHSYSFGAPSTAIDAALLRARDAGIVNVASTGNENLPRSGYPASSPYCLGVGASNRFGGRAFFSNYDSGLDFMAPGEAIITTDRVGAMGIAGDYATVSGTSFASPYAAGVAALVISRNPTWTAAQVEQRMKETCTDMGTAGFDSNSGWGHLNAARALTGGSGPVIPQPPVDKDDIGDTIATATSVAIPSTTNGAIQRAGDLDVFRFVTTSTLEVTATTTGTTDTFGDLMNASGTVLASNDDANGSRNFRLVSTLNAGTYYVRVRHSSSSATSGGYQLVLTSRLPAAPEIRVRGNGVEIVNNNATPSPHDHTSFGQVTASGGVIERIFTIDNIGSGDLRLTGSPSVVISGSGAPQFSVQALPSATISPGRSTTFALRFRPTSNGTFAAMVSLTNTDGDENPTTFAINGSANIPTRDDLPNSFPGRTVDRISNTPAALNHAGDEDFVTFVMPWTRTVVMETLGSTDTAGALLDSSGRVLASDSSSGSGGNFRIQRVLGAGTYHLRIKGQTSSTVGSYIISLH